MENKISRNSSIINLKNTVKKKLALHFPSSKLYQYSTSRKEEEEERKRLLEIEEEKRQVQKEINDERQRIKAEREERERQIEEEIQAEEDKTRALYGWFYISVLEIEGICRLSV